MQDIDDPLLKDRMHDLEDLSNRLLRIVFGRMGTAAQTGLRTTGSHRAQSWASRVLEYDRRRLKGVVLEEGSLTAHMTIVARQWACRSWTSVRHSPQRDEASRSWSTATTAASPPPDKVLLSASRTGSRRAIRSPPGSRRRETCPPSPRRASISVMVNAGLAEDAANLEASGADGIGLFRTEFQFLVSATLPGRDRQQRLYSKVLASADGKPVVFRTVDIGGDKALPYLTDIRDEAENPAMGWRARLSLERATLMKAQHVR